MDHAIATMAARSHERAVSYLYRHMAIFAVVSVLLAAVDMSTGGTMGAQWIVVGWGAVLALHALLVVRDSRRNVLSRDRAVTRPETETLKGRPPELLPDPPFDTPDSIP